MNETRPLNNIRPLTPTQGLNNVKGLQDVTPLTFNNNHYTSRKRKTPLYIVDDTAEKANSAVEILFSGDQLRTLLEDTPFESIKDIPILNQVAGLVYHPYDAYIKPVIDNGITSGQGYKEAGLNVLTEVSEDLDIFSNIIKSQMPSAGGGFGLQSLSDSIGLNGKRTVYNYNTGNTLGDIVLEVISDPLTVFELGASAAASAGKSAMGSAVKGTTKNLSKQASKDWAKAVVKTIAKEGKDATFESILKNVSRRSLKEISEAGLKKSSSKIIDAVIKSKGYQMFLSASKLKSGAQAIDDVLTKAAWYYTPVGLPAKYGKEALKAGAEHIYKNLMTNLQKYDLEKNFVKKQGVYKEALETAILQNNAINETIFKNNAKFFRMLGIDETKLQQYYYGMLKTMKNFDENTDIYEAFRNYLIKNNENAQKAMIFNKNFADFIHSTDFEQLVDAVSIGPSQILRAEQELTSRYHAATLNSMQKYINRNSKNLEATYRYINDTVLSYNGKQFGLNNLEDFLAELMTDRTTSKQYLNDVATLLESVGINTQNAPNIAKVLNSNIKDKSTAIKKILEATNTGAKLLTDKEYVHLMNKVNNRIKDTQSSALNKLWKEDIGTYNLPKYKEIINNSIKNIDDAVVRIQSNIDIQHSIAYIQNVIRLQDLPEFKDTLNLIEVALEEQPGLLDPTVTKLTRDHIASLEKFLKQTNRIVDKMGDTTAIASEIPDWWAKLEKTQQTLTLIQRTFDTHGGPYAVKARDKLYKISEALEVFKQPEIIDPLVNYVDNINGLMQPQLSHLGMFSVLTQHTHLANNTELKTFLEQMSMRDSIMRTQIIPDLVNKFNDAGLYAQAANLNKVAAQVDTVINLQRMLETEIPTSFKLSNKTQQDLKTLLFDIIDNHSSYTIADIYSTSVKSYSDWINNVEPLTQYQVLIKDIDDRITNTKTILERIAKDTPNLNQANVLDEIKEQMHNMLDDYINAQSKIQNVDNVSLSVLYSTDTIEALELNAKIEFALARNTDISIEVLNEYNTLMRNFYQFAEGIQMGIDEIQEWNKKFQAPLNKAESDKILREFCESYNLFSSSVESGMFTNKYIVPKNFAEVYKLPTEAFVGSNQEYLMLSERLNWYKDVLHDEYKYEDKYISKLREVLSQTYSQPNALFAPKNPTMYFQSLDPEQLLAWEVVTKGNLSIRNKTNFYTFYTQLTHKADVAKYTMSDYLADLETVFRNKGFTDDEAIAHIASISRNANAMEYANRTIDANLMYTLHDLDDLGKYKDDIVKSVEDDVKAVDDITKTIIDIENSPDIRQSYADFGNTDDLHKMTGASYGYEDVLYRSNEMQYAERCTGKAVSIANMNAEELATHIYRQTPGAMAFYNQNIIRTMNPDGSVTWSGLDNIFNFSKKELKDAGLKIKQDGDWFYIRLTDNRVHNATLKYEALATDYEAIQKRYTDLIDKYRIYLNMYEEGDIPSNLITVEPLNKETWDKFMLDNADFFGDTEEQKLYQKLTKGGYSNFFDKSFSRLNFTVVGGFDAYNIWNSLYSDSFIKHSTQMSRNTLSGLTAFINRSNKINKYLTMFFNNDYALDNPLFTKMFSEASDERIAQFFAEDKYRVVILRKDKQGLPKVFEYAVNNRHQLERATSIGAIMVPKETYTAMKQVVNNRQMSNSLLDIYRRVVPSTYKTMYLTTVGFPFRNFLDSMIFKNGNELGGITELPRVFRYEREASKAIEFHNKIQFEVLAETAGETFNKEELFKVLNRYNQEEVQLYFLIDLFMESNASGGLSESLSNWLEAYNKLHTEDLRPMWEKVYEDKVLFGKQKLNPLYRLRELNSHIEQTARLGLFLASVDEGLPISEAIERVIKTHFDYNSSSDLLDICERIFWFSTFPINNLNYYVSGGLTKSPSMTKLVMDTQVASWNNGEYTYEELKKTNFLAYHALTGNIRIGNWIVKTSPSLFDFINLVTDLPGNIRDRVNPFIAVATGTVENPAEEIYPAITQYRNWQKFKEGNPIPSVLSKINEYDWNNTLFKWRNRYRQSNWTSYPRLKRPVAYKKYLRKYFSRRYRTDVRKFMRTSLYHDAVNYYKVTKRGATYRDL